MKNELLKQVSKYFSEGLLECVAPAEIRIMKDDKDAAYLYYRNGCVKIKREDELSLINMKQLTYPVWESSIIDREFSEIRVKRHRSEFERFLWNVVRDNENRMLSLCSAIGYLAHGFKDKSNSKAIILCDEKVSEEPNGRTGKESDPGKALTMIKPMSRVDGKNFDFNPRFTFQLVSLATRIIDFNDVKKNFDFEKLFSVITDDMTVEYKNKQPFIIKYEESPKILDHYELHHPGYWR